MDIGELFPKAMGRPINGHLLLPDEYQKLKFLSWRNKGGNDSLIPFGGVPVAIGTTGMDFEGRVCFRDASIVKLFQSFPPSYILDGSNNLQLSRIGNSVPPLLMYAIATQIRHKLWNGPELKPMNKKIDYPAHLDMMWQKHLEPRQPNAPTVISTFAGGGGSSLGYSMAGYRELLAVEWDNNAVETFKLNFPDVPVYHGDIAKLSVDECLELAGVEPRELDILDGSPPCQGFSTAGKRNLDDPRNQLFREYVRLLQGLKPKVFVMENVSGMVKGKMKLVFAEILRELRGSGYVVSARLLNAMYFHVPQSRQRMIFIGVREDLGIEPSHPKAESSPIGLKIICPDALSSKSQQINPEVKSIYPHVTLQKLSFLRETILTKNGRREPSKQEVMMIGSFPLSYEFFGDGREYWSRIGNSVPPLMMEAIARYIKENILIKVPAILS